MEVFEFLDSQVFAFTNKEKHMTCPSCNQPATTFWRNAFSLQGVSIPQALKGNFKCQHCGTLLSITSFGKLFWYFFCGAVIVLALFVLLHRRLIVVVGTGATAWIWIVIVLAIVSVLVFGMWKYAQIQKVNTDPRPN